MQAAARRGISRAAGRRQPGPDVLRHPDGRRRRSTCGGAARMTRPIPAPPGPGQESAWDYPRPPRVEPVAERIRVVVDGIVVADTSRGAARPRDEPSARLLPAAGRRPPRPPRGIAADVRLRVQGPRLVPDAGAAVRAPRPGRGMARTRTRPRATRRSPATCPSTPAASTRRGSATSASRRRRATSTAAGSPRASSARSRAGPAAGAGDPALGLVRRSPTAGAGGDRAGPVAASRRRVVAGQPSGVGTPRTLKPPST